MGVYMLVKDAAQHYFGMDNMRTMYSIVNKHPDALIKPGNKGTLVDVTNDELIADLKKHGFKPVKPKTKEEKEMLKNLQLELTPEENASLMLPSEAAARFGFNTAHTIYSAIERGDVFPNALIKTKQGNNFIITAHPEFQNYVKEYRRKMNEYASGGVLSQRGRPVRPVNVELEQTKVCLYDGCELPPMRRRGNYCSREHWKLDVHNRSQAQKAS